MSKLLENSDNNISLNPLEEQSINNPIDCIFVFENCQG